MSVFDPESTNNSYRIGCDLTGQPGNPYRFTLSFDVDGTAFQINDMSMGDLVDLNRAIGRTIRMARAAKKHKEAE